METQTLGAPELVFAELPMAADRGVGWQAVRDAGRVVLIDGWYYISHRADVLAALRDPELFSSKKAFDILGSPLPLVPLSLDPPDHTRFRKILQPFFSPKTLNAMLPALQKQAVDIIDPVVAKGTCEAVQDIAIPYPSQVFLTLFGLPLTDRDRLIAWKDAVIAISEAPSLEDADLTPALELVTYLTDTVAARRGNPGPDILSQLLNGEDAIEDAEILGLAFLFVLAGLDTVTAAMSAALLELARHPELRAMLRGDPSQMGVFVDEIVRLEPPAPILPRVTTAEVTIGDITLPPDTKVKLCIGAINRDDADEISGNHVVMDGKVHRHWGFGGGAHRCLGSHLARMELTLVIGEWVKRVPEFAVEDGFEPEIVFPANTFGLARLPLTLG